MNRQFAFEHKNFAINRRQAITAAKELYYGPHVITELKSARNDIELSKIMAKARKEKWEDC